MSRAILPALLLLWATAAHAQRSAVAVSGSALAYQAEYLLRFEGAVQEQSGTLLGGEGALRIRRFRLLARGFTGTLAPSDQDPANPRRQVRVSEASLQFTPVRSLSFGADVAARRYVTNVGTTLWRLVGASAGLSQNLGTSALVATADIAVYPLAKVTNDAKLRVAMRAVCGLQVAPGSGRFVLQLAYRFERFDFEGLGNTPARLDQMQAIAAGIGVRLGR